MHLFLLYACISCIFVYPKIEVCLMGDQRWVKERVPCIFREWPGVVFFFHDYLVLKRGMALIVILFWSLFVCLFYATKMEIQRNIQRNIFAKQVFFFWFLGLDLGCGPTLLSPDPSYAVCFCLSQSPSFLISYLLLLSPMRFFFGVLFEMPSAFPWILLTFSVNISYSQELRSNHMNLPLKMICDT